MEINISGLKCDHCEYRDDALPFSEYKESIGKPCPNCGESLLTLEEYNDCLRSYELVAVSNRVARVTRWLNPLHYWRLIFGDKRKTVSLKVIYPNRVIDNK